MRTTLPEPAPGSDREVARAFSLSGVVPLGAFLVLHVAANASALLGGWAFVRSARLLRSLPALPFLELAFVFVPLLFHGGLGLWLIVTRRALDARRGSGPTSSVYTRPLRLAMRATADGALAFLALHLPELRFRSGLEPVGPAALATLLDARLSSTWRGIPWAGVAYLTGAACATFHFACGAWGYFASTPRGRADARTRKRVAWVAVGAGIAMWVLFADVVVLRATGSALIGEPSEGPSSEPCPIP
jgi:succinate dehydrogenase / fumarate reductase cytochrome b subunit